MVRKSFFQPVLIIDFMFKDFAQLETGARLELDDPKTLDDILEVAQSRQATVDFTFKVIEKRIVKCGPETNILLDIRSTKFEDFNRLLVLKEYRGLVDVAVYERPDFFEEGSRAQIMEQHGWLFDTSEEYDELSDYPYVDNIHDDSDNTFLRIERDEVGMNEGHGIRTCLMEYRANPEVDNDRVLIVEVGVLDSANGGWIEFWNGRLIEDFNVRLGGSL